MPVTTASAAYHITPVVLKTFLEHYKRKGRKLKEGSENDNATDDIFFDQAFHIVKAFLDMATHNTVESLQSFANTHIPSPFWAAVSPVQIPLSTCNQAADVMMEWFGEEDLKVIIGGERWWQVRGLDGIDGEWITEREYLSDAKPSQKTTTLSTTDADIPRMDDVNPVMFYVHGGGYYFGSINTHRYQILRYARKMRGRAFAVNYRKAPQYPFPCALQDVLAAYLYIIDPPPEALHKPVPSSKIIFAGDSAGGGLCINVLTILRDMQIPMPAGAVLISPWVDLTHSFPSVMENVATDIIPPCGFMAKPSTLWPVEMLPENGEGRVETSKTGAPPQPGHPDTLRPDKGRLQEQRESRALRKGEGAANSGEAGASQEMLPGEYTSKGKDTPDAEGSQTNGHSLDGSPPTLDMDEIDLWEPKPPKVLMDDPKVKPLELRAQIQLYATNEQLTHPVCSPILQGSLGNLCPLYIIGGGGEALRDEIIYLAHKAAHPDRYPTRKGALRDSKRQRENVEKYKSPTKVHLQIYDDMCHVLTVFTFTDAARYAYRSIAQFARHVTSHSEDHLARNPFPELHEPQSPIPPDSPAYEAPKSMRGKEDVTNGAKYPLSRDKQPTNREGSANSEQSTNPLRPSLSRNRDGASSDIQRYRSNEDIAVEEVKAGEVDTVPGEPVVCEDAGLSKDIPNALFIRERVDIFGRVRPMEPPEDVPALQLKPSQIGIIKEAPVKRWSEGQAEWDRKYRSLAHKVKNQRRQNQDKALKMIRSARQKGLVLVEDVPAELSQLRSTMSRMSEVTMRSNAEIQEDRRWGPLDLDGERVPASAICNRTDTPEALALLKKSVYYTAPITHRTIPNIKPADIVRAALNPHDRAAKAPKQSVSEQQQSKQPIHGLRMWSGLVNYFLKQSSMEREKGRKHIAKASRKTSDILQHPSHSSQGLRHARSGRNP